MTTASKSCPPWSPYFGSFDVLMPIDERLERLGLGLDIDADLLVLLRGDLNERLADLLPELVDERKLELLAVFGVDAVTALGPPVVLQQLLGFGRIVLVVVQVQTCR